MTDAKAEGEGGGSRIKSPPPMVDSPVKYIMEPHQLNYLKNTVMKAVWKHQFCWPFQTPVENKIIVLLIVFFVST